MTPALEIEGLDCALGQREVLSGLSMAIPFAQRVALLGPNGAGKSSLLRVIAGQLTPSAGTIRVAGWKAGSRAARARLGLIPQRLSLFRRLSIRENIEAFAILQGANRSNATSAAARAIRWIGLEARADDLIANLSGGMQRRVSVACGAIHDPRLLLADEAMVGVDTRHREPLEVLLADLREEGTSIVESTHELRQVDAQIRSRGSPESRPDRRLRASFKCHRSHQRYRTPLPNRVVWFDFV